ncbi:MAG: hypothetical protein E6Q32_06620 [Neisseriales bacterium]|nr:MAG: hypothetical protein E6Q32_06620 [Neisseriales bacterium]
MNHEYINLSSELTAKQITILHDWVRWCAEHSNNNLVKNASSYYLKHFLEGQIYSQRKPRTNNYTELTIFDFLHYKFDWFYIGNNQFKQAMLDCKVNIKNPDSLNWQFAGGYIV